MLCNDCYFSFSCLFIPFPAKLLLFVHHCLISVYLSVYLVLVLGLQPVPFLDCGLVY